jgi:tetratricopeptide (TPR) repeat protein
MNLADAEARRAPGVPKGSRISRKIPRFGLEETMKSKILVMSAIAGSLLAAATALSGSGQVDDLEARLKKNPEDRTLLLSLGRTCHNLAFLANDGRLVEKAEKYLTRLLDIDPRNAAAMVYLGSTKTQKAQTRQNRPWEAMEFLQEGFTWMDKAVQTAPDEAEVRFLRGANSVQIPDAFGRLPVALDDFQVLETLITKNPACLDKGMVSAARYYYGLALLKAGDRAEADRAFRRAIESDPESSYAEKARAELARRRDRT